MTVAWISWISLWEEQKFTLRNLHFWDQLKASFSSNICPDCISCHLEFQNFQREDPRTPPPTKKGVTTLSDSPPPTTMALGDMPNMPVACPVSTYFQKFSIYFKTFWEPWSHKLQCYSIHWPYEYFSGNQFTSCLQKISNGANKG